MPRLPGEAAGLGGEHPDHLIFPHLLNVAAAPLPIDTTNLALRALPFELNKDQRTLKTVLKLQ
ncbi:MAG: hypothetical protein AB1589_35335 [Cyanobacteriota bacterium]